MLRPLLTSPGIDPEIWYQVKIGYLAVKTEKVRKNCGLDFGEFYWFPPNVYQTVTNKNELVKTIFNLYDIDSFKLQKYPVQVSLILLPRIHFCGAIESKNGQTTTTKFPLSIQYLLHSNNWLKHKDELQAAYPNRPLEDSKHQLQEDTIF